MDYEKKYNEALERTRALWREAIEKEYVNDYLKDYETIFPELRESEDERIRKHLIKHFSNKSNKSKEEWNGMPIKDILAWLEKQKEQMPADWTDKDKRILDDISHLLIMFKYTEMAKAYKKAIEKLIYQPYWKPSEEQMEALKDAVRLFKETHFEKFHYKIESLYEQLKKLM